MTCKNAIQSWEKNRNQLSWVRRLFARLVMHECDLSVSGLGQIGIRSNSGNHPCMSGFLFIVC